MPPELALQALSFVLHGGTYFPPTAILASQTFSAPAPIEYRQPEPIEIRQTDQEQLLPGPEQQMQAPPLGPEDGLYEPQGSLFDDKVPGVQRDHGFNGVRHHPSLPSGSTPFWFVSARATPTRSSVASSA